MVMTAVNRRSLVAGGAAGCLALMTSGELAQARAAAQQSGKPILTTESLNAAIPPPNSPRHRTVLLEAARDPRAYLRAHFTLTPAQEAEIASISQGHLDALQASLRSAAASRQPVNVAINKLTPAAAAGGVLQCNQASICVSVGTEPPLAIGVATARLRSSGARPPPGATLPPRN